VRIGRNFRPDVSAFVATPHGFLRPSLRTTEAMWWAVITMTTVGYGKALPRLQKAGVCG
jgi:voltage-gated potassium channel Kch